MDRIHYYNPLVNEIIKKSFPSLKGKKIFLLESGLFKYSASTIEFLFFGLIVVNKKSRKYSRSALKGLFAHELSHLAVIRDMGFFEMFYFSLKWIFSRRTRVDFETRADRLVIKKRYGKDLIQLKKEGFKGKSKEYLEKVYSRGYLSINEIKQEMKKLK